MPGIGVGLSSAFGSRGSAGGSGSTGGDIFFDGLQVGVVASAPGMPYDGMIPTSGEAWQGTKIDYWHPTLNPTGRYTPCAQGSKRRALSPRFDTNWNGETIEVSFDERWKGDRSQSRTALNFGSTSIVSNGTNNELQIRMRALTANEKKYSGRVTNSVAISSAWLGSGPSFAWSGAGNWVLDYEITQSATNVTGQWVGSYTSSIYWPFNGEVDWYEVINANGINLPARGNMIHDGGTTSTTQVINNGTFYDTTAGWNIPEGQRIRVMIAKIGNDLFGYDNTAGGPGSAPTLRVTAPGVANSTACSGVHRYQMQATSRNYDSAYDGNGITMNYGWWRVFTPAAGGANLPTVILTAADVGLSTLNMTAAEVTSNATKVFTLPSMATMWANGPIPATEEVVRTGYNIDDPGQISKFVPLERWNVMPGGPGGKVTDTNWQFDSTARTITGALPSTEGGVMSMYIYGRPSGGGPCRRALLQVFFPPVEETEDRVVWKLFANRTTALGRAMPLNDTGAWRVEHDAFHSGVYNHTYTATTSNSAIIAYTIDADGFGITFTPQGYSGADTDVTLTITATDEIGNAWTTTRTVEVRAAAVWSEACWDALHTHFDPNDMSKLYQTNTFSVDGNGVVASTPNTPVTATGQDVKYMYSVNRTDGRFSLGNNNTAGTLTLATQGARTMLKYNSGTTTMLRKGASTAGGPGSNIYGDELTGTNKPFCIIGRSQRGTTLTGMRLWASENSTNNLSPHAIGITSGNAMSFVLNGTAILTSAVQTGLLGALVFVWGVHYDGTTLRLYLNNGTTPISTLVTSIGATTVDGFMLGAQRGASGTVSNSMGAAAASMGDVFFSRDLTPNSNFVNAMALLGAMT